MANKPSFADHQLTKQRRGTLNVSSRPQRPKRPVVYFVQASNGLIKIGSTKYISDRFATLQSHSPIPVTLLATIPGYRTEKFMIHARFAAHRQHGEWFDPHPDILAEIERLEPKGTP